MFTAKRCRMTLLGVSHMLVERLHMLNFELEKHVNDLKFKLFCQNEDCGLIAVFSATSRLTHVTW